MSTARVPLKNAMLPKGSLRWRFFGAGVFVQTALLVMLMMAPLLFPDRVNQFHRYLITEMNPPLPVRVPRFRAQRMPRRLPDSVAKSSKVPISHSDIPSPVPAIPRVKHISAIITPEGPKISVQPQIPIDLPPPAIPLLQRPREPVHIGEFGDASGAIATTRFSQSRVTQVGDFNGHDGADAGASLAAPFEILFKPTPKYTQVAAEKRIQGQVLLEVCLSATGEPKVLGLIRGLGYGLNQTAEDAARQIKFRPARNDGGTPIDSIVIVRIVFEWR